MGLKTAMGEVFPRWQRGTVDLVRSAAGQYGRNEGPKPRDFTFCKRYASSVSVMKSGT